MTQGVLRMLSLCSGSAQVKAAAAHVRRLKRNQRKKKLILSLWEFLPHRICISKVMGLDSPHEIASRMPKTKSPKHRRSQGSNNLIAIWHEMTSLVSFHPRFYQEALALLARSLRSYSVRSKCDKLLLHDCSSGCVSKTSRLSHLEIATLK